VSDPLRFQRSRRLVWFTIVVANVQMFALLVTGHDMAGEVYLAGVPTQLALAGGFAGLTNWAEVRKP